MKYSLQKRTQFSLGSKALYTLLLPQMDFFWGTDMFFLISWTGLSESNRAYLPLLNYHLQDVFLSNTNSMSSGKQWFWCSCFEHFWFSFERYICFLNSAELASWEHTWHISSWKHLSCRKYSLQKLIQFFHRNNVLHANAFNRDGCPWRYTCLSSTHPNRSIWKKMHNCPNWK
jgi:hypothetical protein